MGNTHPCGGLDFSDHASRRPDDLCVRRDDPDRAFETLATQLRRADGIGRLRFREQTGFELDALVGERVANLVREGLLSDDGAAVRLTRRGFCVADGIVEDLLTANVRPGEPGACAPAFRCPEADGGQPG